LFVLRRRSRLPIGPLAHDLTEEMLGFTGHGAAPGCSSTLGWLAISVTTNIDAAGPTRN
jgi:hypothetical protein